MQGGAAHRSTGQTHRLEKGVGSQHTGAAHLNDDVQQLCRFFLGGIFIGHRPPGHLGGGAQLLPLCQIVDLDDDAVDAAGQFFPPVTHGADKVKNGLHIAGDDIRFHHFTAMFFQIFQRLRMGLEAQLPCVLHIEAEHTQLALGTDAAVQLAQRACGGISGVGKQLLPGGLPLGIQPVKDLVGHIDLAADPQMFVVGVHSHGHIKNGLDVFGDIFAHMTVAPGSTQNELSIFIFQTDRKAVDFQLHGVFHLREAFLHAPVKIPDLLKGKHILQALHGIGVAHLFKALQHRTDHPLGGRIGSGKLGILCLQLPQTALHFVIFKVGDFGRILVIIAPRVVKQLFGELLHLLLNVLHGLHTPVAEYSDYTTILPVRQRF